MDTEKCKHNVCDMIEHANWINVEDELPNQDEECLVCSQDGLYALATYSNRKWFHFFEPEFIKINFKVRSWMTLPAPPTMDG